MTRNRKASPRKAIETRSETAGRRSKSTWAALLLAGIAIAGAGIAIFSRGGARNELGMPASGAARGFNVLLVTFDTTRPDHLGCYGAGFARTPAIDSLSKNGVWFENAAVTVPLTLPSHTSMLTGKYPYHHGVRTNTGYDVQPTETTLAERLKSAGYATAAFVSCFVLDARFGLNQGFDVYDFEASEKGNRGPESVFSQREASLTSARATAWLKDHFKTSSGKPFFLWVHYYDPHHPFDSPLTNQPEFAGRPYDAEIAYADSQLANVIGEISNAGAADRTLTVFATDHGESLGEHGESAHGIFIYDATIHGGLIFSNPSLFAGEKAVSNRMVSTIDIAPTVLGLLGLPALTDADGIDLAATIPAADRRIFIESLYPVEGRGCAPVFGLRSTSEKFISAPIPEFYDLSADNGEKSNLFKQAPASIIPFEKEMNDLFAAHPEIKSPGAVRRSMSPDELKQLATLGYTGGIETAGAGSLPDAKERIALFEKSEKARELVKTGHIEEGLALAIESMTENPGDESSAHTVAHIYEGLGRSDDAIRVLEDFARKHPTANVLIHLAKVLASAGRWEEFEKALQAAELIEPGRGSIPFLRGERLMEAGRFREAVVEFEKAMELDPNRMGAKEREALRDAKRLAGMEPG